MISSNGHILVVDDNLTNRQLASAHLVAAGYSVALAEGGEEALKLYAERPPDLVLLDVMMPGIDGFETCVRLRALPGGEDTAVVFVTALNDLGSHQRAMASGADDFLTKPINRTELLLRVRSLLWIKHLKRELRDGYDLIRSQRDALLTAQRQREELTSLVVHDLKNPLTAILFNAEWLAENCPEEDAVCARQIVNSAQSMNRMVTNLLDISKSEDGVLEPRLSHVELDAVVKKVVDSLSAFGTPPSIEVSSVPAPIEGDPELLRRMVENLLDNAKKYSPPGSTIRVFVERESDKSVLLRVCDQGSGVPLDQRERIFDKYARLDAGANEMTGSGRGLGLTFCRLAADVHGGRIWVDDGIEGGSSFNVQLPVQHGLS